MIKHLALCLMFLFLSTGWATAASSVWKVQKGNAVIYLGGTIHLLRDADLPPPTEFETAYRSARTVIFETDIARLKEPATQQLLLSRAVYRDGSGIEQHLSPATMRQLAAYCEANGIPLQALRQLKPAMLMSTLTFLELAKLGITQQGVDSYFYQLARKDGKKVIGLESVEQQVGYVVSLADGIEDEVVSHSLREMGSLGQQYEELTGSWRNGDTRRLGDLLVTELKERWPRLYRRLITERNSNWLPQLEAALKSREPAFVLVGVAHLVGPDGLLAALAKRGYMIERL